jgi:uncharacterized protein YdaU (DUF1376 family)
MHYYKRNLGDYAKKAGRLSMLQHGSYTLLIDACYDREQFPTREEAIDWTWASSAAEIEAVDFVLSKFFDLEDGFYVQTRIRDELAEYRGKAITNKRIADEREAKRKEEVTNRARTVDEATPNHKPLTINHKPINTEPNGSTSAARLPTCPTQIVIDLYHEVLPDLPKVRLTSAPRSKAIASLWKFVLTTKTPEGLQRASTSDQAVSWIRQYFERASQNDFLMGRGQRTGEHAGWQCDIDFLMTERGMKQVIEKTRMS